MVTAARVASRLTDPRLTQVFDAAEHEDHSYVVSEWVTGDTLADLLAAGPLEPERAAGLVAEAAEALAHAHEADLYHLCLRPAHLVWTTGNTVKVLGVAVDAALSGLTTDQPALDDAEGLGRLLYAGLSGHWPGDEEEGGLPTAPMIDGHFCTPRQVTAGVPGYLDAVTIRSCLPESRQGHKPPVQPVRDRRRARQRGPAHADPDGRSHDDAAGAVGLALRGHRDRAAPAAPAAADAAQTHAPPRPRPAAAACSTGC